ncbi:MAG: calcium/sodium antiporter [Candidatus Omnitrophica bacterium]|nr:calcium/sodium antiporter [Candidatus Omnitrophota bacterium]MDD5488479.1 calcium/sodium antiporter [Candidatus Omnitrophota bacterium]
MNAVLLVLGFMVLIKGADILVDGACLLAKRLRISDLVIGLTLVAFGTSAPEFFVNIMASAKGATDIALSNVVGSNIANVLLVLGIAAVIYPLEVGKGTVWKEIPLSLVAVTLLLLLVNDAIIDESAVSALTRIDGMVFILFFGLFLYYTAGISKDIKGLPTPPDMAVGYTRIAAMVLAGLAGLVLGGHWVVTGAVRIAEHYHISQSLIGLTIVAVGTSLPELATSAVAAYKKNSDIAVGNIVGSCIFNIFFVLGISALLRPIPLSAGGNVDISVALIAAVMLFVFMFTGKRHRLDKWEGMVFVGVYLAYIIFVIKRG